MNVFRECLVFGQCQTTTVQTLTSNFFKQGSTPCHSSEGCAREHLTLLRKSHTEQRRESNSSCFHILHGSNGNTNSFPGGSFPLVSCAFPEAKSSFLQGAEGTVGCWAPGVPALSSCVFVCRKDKRQQAASTAVNFKASCDLAGTVQTFWYTALMKQINNSKFYPSGWTTSLPTSNLCTPAFNTTAIDGIILSKHFFPSHCFQVNFDFFWVIAIKKIRICRTERLEDRVPPTHQSSMLMF